MSFLKRKNVPGKERVVKKPSFDPYDRFKNTGDGVFGFRKDKHVIIPGVTSYEEEKLKGVGRYVEKQTGEPCTLSNELINDIYSIYVNKEVKRRPETKDNSIRHKVIDKVYDSLTKIVTEDSPLYSHILTRELALILQKVDKDMKKEQQDENESGEGDGESKGLESSGSEEEKEDSSGSENSPNSGSGQETGLSNKSSISENIAEKLLNKAEKEIEKAKYNADEKIKDLESQLGKEAMKDLMNTNPEFLEEIDRLKDNLKKVSINKNSIRKVLEKILNESSNYFSSKFKRKESSLLDCEEYDDLFGLEFLHPIFRNAEIMNVGNEERIYKGKIDLFLDCSISMNSTEVFEGTPIRMIDLAKGIAMILYRMKMINNLYFFDGDLHEIDNVNEISILSFSKSGGTDFNNVVRKIKENGNNSVVITDGFDGCNEYTSQAFWIGVGGTTFDRDDEFKKYRAASQCVSYNSASSNFNYCKKK